MEGFLDFLLFMVVFFAASFLLIFPMCQVLIILRFSLPFLDRLGCKHLYNSKKVRRFYRAAACHNAAFLFVLTALALWLLPVSLKLAYLFGFILCFFRCNPGCGWSADNAQELISRISQNANETSFMTIAAHISTMDLREDPAMNTVISCFVVLGAALLAAVIVILSAL